jgi:hypothetical protein
LPRRSSNRSRLDGVEDAGFEALANDHLG